MNDFCIALKRICWILAFGCAVASAIYGYIHPEHITSVSFIVGWGSCAIWIVISFLTEYQLDNLKSENELSKFNISKYYTELLQYNTALVDYAKKAEAKIEELQEELNKLKENENLEDRSTD